MRAVVQKVSNAWVEVDGEVTGKIGDGLLVYLGIEEDDNDEDLAYIVDKVSNIRVFHDENDKMNLSVKDVGGSVLAVSQFTLYGDCRKGRRPSFTKAAKPEMAKEYYNQFVESIKKMGIPVETGVFQAHMYVNSINDGPVTILLDSKKNF